MRTEQNVNYRGLMALVEEVAQTEAALERVRLIVHAMAKRSGVRVPSPNSCPASHSPVQADLPGGRRS